MIPEYSTESFQCGSRCLSHRAVCSDLPAPGQGGRSANRERCDLALHCLHRAHRAVWQRHDRRTRELSQAKSKLWHCRGDSSQTLSEWAPVEKYDRWADAPDADLTLILLGYFAWDNVVKVVVRRFPGKALAIQTMIPETWALKD
jgi:hypothetical protein